jgi:hypothetical protein
MPLPSSSYLKAYERDEKLRAFCEEWLIGAVSGESNIEQDSRIYRAVEESPDRALMCAVSLVELAKEKEVTNEMLAGPFETLLARRGSEYIDIVCELSRSLPRLPRILACIWGQHIPKAVMRKIELFRTA